MNRKTTPTPKHYQFSAMSGQCPCTKLEKNRTSGMLKRVEKSLPFSLAQPVFPHMSIKTSQGHLCSLDLLQRLPTSPAYAPSRLFIQRRERRRKVVLILRQWSLMGGMRFCRLSIPTSISLHVSGYIHITAHQDSDRDRGSCRFITLRMHADSAKLF